MRSSPLRLKELFFPQVSVKALVPVKPESAAQELDIEDLDISFGLDFASDGQRASAGLKIASKNSSAKSLESAQLYSIRIEAFANFEVVAPEHQDGMAVYLRKFAAAAALIGAAREQVALMTARGPWGVVMLPIISMDRVVGPPPKIAPAKKASKGKQLHAKPSSETVAAMIEARETTTAGYSSAKELFDALDKKAGNRKARTPSRKA